MTLRRALRYVKWTVGGATAGVLVGGSLAYLKINNWDLASSGAVRFGRAAVAVSHIVVDYKKSLSGVTDEDEYNKIMQEVHLRSALRLRDMCCVNKGCFIKVGQHIGALEFLLPKPYTDTMKVLHSDAPQSTLEELYSVIQEDFGQDVDQLFVDFEEKPLGAASLAQVHRAKLKDGTEVAVKVQHPEVMKHAVVDMATMELLLSVVAWVFPEFQLKWLGEETRKNLPVELDFVNEGHNCDRVRRMFSKFSYMKVPKVHWDYTTPRVLTMEYCEGGQVNDSEYMKKHNISVNEVSKKLGEIYSEMIFVQGYIHCDPHPGNVLVKKTSHGAQIVLLDHGLYQTLTDDFRLDYCKLWMSMMSADVPGMQKYSGRLGCGHLYGLFACMVAGRSWDALTSGMEKVEYTEQEEKDIKENVSQYIPEIAAVLNLVPRQMLLIFKTNDLLRGIESSLKTRSESGSFITMSRCCARAVYSRRKRLSTSWLQSVRLECEERWILFKLSLYALYLRFSAAYKAPRMIMAS